MFGKELAHDEVYYKEYGEYKIAGSYTVYESYIEKIFDHDGKELTNKDGTPRYRYINDKDIVTTKEDKIVKEIRKGVYKDVYQVNGDYVEKVEKEEGKRVYFVVEPQRVKTLPSGTNVIIKNGLYRVLEEVGYVLVDDYDVENPKIITVRKFNSDDHKKEAEEIVKNRLRKFKENND